MLPLYLAVVRLDIFTPSCALRHLLVSSEKTLAQPIAIASERSGLVVGSIDGDLPLDTFVLVR